MRKDLSTILQMGLSYALIFSAFNSQGLIEVSVLRRMADSSPETGITHNSGYYSLSIIYFVFTFVNLVIPPVVKKLGSKWSQVIGSIGYLFFMLTFLYLNAALLYFGSAILGASAALLWAGNGTYMVEFSRKDKMERNAGILWAMLQSSLITGGFFLIYVLNSGDLIAEYKLVYTVFSIVTAAGILVQILLPSSPQQYEILSDQQLEEIVAGSEEDLVAAEEGNDPLGLELPNNGDGDEFTVFSYREQFGKTFTLLKSPNMLVLSVIFFYSGLEMTFYTGVYTGCLSSTLALKAYSDLVIPYNALALGAGQIMGGIVTGTVSRLLKLRHHHIVFFALLCHIVAFFFCFLILPYDSTIDKSDMPTYATPTLLVTLFISFLLGISDAFWQTQIYVTLGTVYKYDPVNAFAIFKFFQSFAACISFYYSSYLYLPSQLTILAVGCFLSAIFFLKMGLKIENASESARQSLD